MRTIFTLLAFVALSMQAADKPNVVLIFIDDMGYGDIGPFGNKVNKTPHLDRMAKEGLKLTQFYVSNTACTPSRSALMTGTYAHRIGMDGRVVFPGEKRGLNPKEITIAELLKKRGYVTGCFGKWHLGDQSVFLPLAQGFDEYFGIPYSNDMWPGNKRGNPLTNRGPYTPLPVIRQDKTDLEKVTELNLTLADLTDVTGLGKLSQLKTLYLYSNNLTHVKGLEKLMQLKVLALNNNRLTEVKGLEKLTKLKELSLHSNYDLTKAQITELQKALPKCKITHDAKK